MQATSKTKDISANEEKAITGAEETGQYPGPLNLIATRGVHSSPGLGSSGRDGYNRITRK